jgi:hypothetical protein
MNYRNNPGGDFDTKIKLSKFWLMLYNSFQIFGWYELIYS